MAINKWRTPEDASSGLIGPNAILQMLPVLEEAFGQKHSTKILAGAGLLDLPDGKTMVPESDAARLHRQLRKEEPVLAPFLTSKAGERTADYILAHRIPVPAQVFLKMLPRSLAAHMLSKAIGKHAWTFVGSGRFGVVTPWVFEIVDNPLIRRERSALCLCDWHAAVFTRLYSQLVAKNCFCIETCCAAQVKADLCRFEIRCM